jgi:hypothetical protein
MITALEVRNFRAFERQRIKFAPITLLFGPNNCGKSALLSGLTVLAQTCRSPDPGVPLLLSGAHEDLGTYGDLVFKNHRRRKVSLQVETTLDPSPATLDEPVPPEKGGLRAGVNVEFRYRIQRREIVIERLVIELPVGTKLFSARYSEDSEGLIPEYLGRELEPASRSSSARNIWWTHFLPQPVTWRTVQRTQTTPEAHIKALKQLSMVSREIMTLLRGLEFIGPFRVPPSRTYLFSGESPATVGRSGERAVDILAADSARRGRRRMEVLESVSKWLRRFGVAEKLRVKTLTDRHFEIQAQHPMTGEYENLADVGYGCSQVLPILVAGCSAPDRHLLPRPVLIVQQPEIHLHPRAQAELGDFFLELALKGTQCIVETHSEHLLLRIQSHVASPSVNLQPEDVAVYSVFARSDGKKEARHLRLNNEGIFIDDWPEGFFPERLAEATKLAREGLRRREKEAANDQ